MKRLTILVVVLLFSFIGCVAEVGPITPEETPAAPSGETPAAPAGETPAAPSGETPAAPAGEIPTDLSGLGYVGLAALGAAVDCTVKTQDSGTGAIQEVKMKMLGNKMRIETEAGGETVVMVMKDNKNYFQLGATYSEFSDCKWLSYEFEGDTAASDMTEGTISMGDIEDLPPTQFTCTLGVFGNEAFDTSGKVCTLEEILGGMYSL